MKEAKEVVRIGVDQGLSQRRACEVMGFHRSSIRYRPSGLSAFTLKVEAKAIELARSCQASGYKMITAILKRLRYPTGKTRVLNIWQRNGLSLPVKKRRKKPTIPYARPCPATAVNDVWCYDFLFTRTEHGETLKVLVVLDEYSRECLDIHVDRKINAHGVMRVLEKIIKERGAPQYMRSDNGPEFIAKNLRQWLGRHQIRPQYIEPGSPWQNGFAESFNETLRRECLNREHLWSRGETQSVCNWWRQLYNYFRPHSSLGYKTPQEFAQEKGFSLLSPPWGFSKKMALIH